jgi:ferric-dicitrate binding protein FerR (iron transport regulator)
MNRPDENHLELIWRHVTGASIPGDDEALARLMGEHPEYATELFAMADERLALETVLREGSSGRLPRRRPRARVFAPRRFPVGLAAAALILAAIAAYFLLKNRDRKDGPSAIIASHEKPAPADDRPDAKEKTDTALRPVRLLERASAGDAPRVRHDPGSDRNALGIEKPAITNVPVIAKDPPADAAPEEPDVPSPDTSVPPSTAETRPKRVRVPVAVLAHGTGRIVFDGPEGAQKAQKGQELLAGSSVRTGPPPSRALLKFKDGTRIDLLSDTDLIAQSEPSDASGRRLSVRQGRILADVAPQPADKPLVIAASTGEARVLGTTLRLDVLPGTAGAIQLEVLSGKVRLVRTRDGRSIDVSSGHFAEIAARDTAFRPRRVVTVSFQDGVSPTRRYAGTRDTTIAEYKEGARRNFGRGASIWADGDTSDMNKPTLDKSAMLRWDLAAIPRNARVIWASIDIDVVNDSRGNPFGMYAMRRPWEELQATWHIPSAGAAWEMPGAQGGKDRGDALLGQFTAKAVGPHQAILTREGLLAVQAWIGKPTRNYGLIVADTRNGDALGFRSREASSPALRPRLTLSFVAR